MPKKILVVGAYGFIGREVAHHLLSTGYEVIGLGRNRFEAERVFPDIQWIITDLNKLTTKDSWSTYLNDVDHVVNCSGILQDQGSDSTLTIHATVVEALALACKENNVGLVQISSVGAEPDASTEFLRTKAIGEQKIKQSGVAHYWIFRPGLVLGQSAYGGTSLLRMVASFPYILPMAFPNSPIQTVSLQDVANCAERAISGRISANQSYDLVESETHSLADILRALRHWLGWKTPVFEPLIPMFLTRGLNQASDLIGLLGWKSQLRSTSSKVLEEGILGDPSKIVAQTGQNLQSLSQTLQTHPARAEDRISALANLLKPVILITLFMFWFLSGAIGFLQLDNAASTLIAVGWPTTLAKLSVIIWSTVDIWLACSLAIRKYAKMATQYMIVVSIIYVLSATVFTPTLWLDPLGPIVKIFPAMVLAMVARAILEVR